MTDLLKRTLVFVVIFPLTVLLSRSTSGAGGTVLTIVFGILGTFGANWLADVAEEVVEECRAR